MIKIVLAGEPIGKGRPRMAKTTGHVYTPPRTASYENRLAWAAQTEMKGRKLMDGPLDVSIRVYLGIPASMTKVKRALAQAGYAWPTKKPDYDNVAKILDALNKVVWLDDAQVVRCLVEKHWSDQPRLEIIITQRLTTCNDDVF